jgi:tetraacyldisaccharide 4'-kinase
MSDPQAILNILSGRSRGPGAMIVRSVTRAIEPLYISAMRVRNGLFNTGIKRTYSLGRPVISVGNITTGGTGKTPVVQWLCEQLIQQGHRPAVLLRGYKQINGISDEAELYRYNQKIEVEPDANRVRAAGRVLKRAPDTTVFILDDGFQHRRVRRDVDIVLIDATNPFGFNHVLPRGLLREPATGLTRADIVIVTRATHSLKPQVTSLTARLRQFNPTAPIYLCQHRITGLTDMHDSNVMLNKDDRVLAFAGIGNPQAFAGQLREDLMLKHVTLDESFADHHAYCVNDLKRISQSGDYDAWVTTEKDYVKISRLHSMPLLRLLRAQLRIDFADGHAEELLMWISNRLRVLKSI